MRCPARPSSGTVLGADASVQAAHCGLPVADEVHRVEEGARGAGLLHLGEGAVGVLAGGGRDGGDAMGII